MSVLVWTDEKMALGREDIDLAHREMVDLINTVAEADKTAFPAAFQRLIAHTEEHFALEQKLMEISADPAHREHENQHAKLLGELAALERQVKRGQLKIARSFVAESLPEWLRSHTASMDSMLAAHLASEQN